MHVWHRDHPHLPTSSDIVSSRDFKHLMKSLNQQIALWRHKGRRTCWYSREGRKVLKEKKKKLWKDASPMFCFRKYVYKTSDCRMRSKQQYCTYCRKTGHIVKDCGHKVSGTKEVTGCVSGRSRTFNTSQDSSLRDDERGIGASRNAGFNRQTTLPIMAEQP